VSSPKQQPFGYFARKNPGRCAQSSRFQHPGKSNEHGLGEGKSTIEVDRDGWPSLQPNSNRGDFAIKTFALLLIGFAVDGATVHKGVHSAVPAVKISLRTMQGHLSAVGLFGLFC